MNRIVTSTILTCLLLGPTISVAQIQRQKPDELEGVGIEERLGEVLPLDRLFRNSQGQKVALGELFNNDRPLLLSLTYTDCPMLCHLQLDGLVESLKQLPLQPAEDFAIVNISIDPLETPSRARQTKQKHIQAYGDVSTAAGWHFLTGEEQDIRAVAQAVGFQYKWVEDRKEYAHAAAIIVCTPRGVVSRYLFGVSYPGSTLRLSIVEASEGKVGSTFDQILLFCFHYDAATGRYSPIAFRIMQMGGLVTLAALATGLLPFWLRRNSRKRRVVARPSATGKPQGGSA